MKKISTHIVALIAGLIIGYLLSNLNVQHTIDKQQNQNNIANLLAKLGDINRLNKKGFPEAGKIFQADVYLKLGEIGNYYKDRNQIPTQLDWISIDPALEYLKNIIQQDQSDQFQFYVEASKGVQYLNNLTRSHKSKH